MASLMLESDKAAIAKALGAVPKYPAPEFLLPTPKPKPRPQPRREDPETIVAADAGKKRKVDEEEPADLGDAYGRVRVTTRRRAAARARRADDADGTDGVYGDGRARRRLRRTAARAMVPYGGQRLGGEARLHHVMR